MRVWNINNKNEMKNMCETWGQRNHHKKIKWQEYFDKGQSLEKRRENLKNSINSPINKKFYNKIKEWKKELKLIEEEIRQMKSNISMNITNEIERSINAVIGLYWKKENKHNKENFEKDYDFSKLFYEKEYYFMYSLLCFIDYKKQNSNFADKIKTHIILPLQLQLQDGIHELKTIMKVILC